MLTVKFEGGKELEKALLELKTATAKNVTRRSGKKALEPVAAKARHLAPKENLDLERSISVSTKATHKPKKSDVEIFVGVAKEESKVGIQQEFGNIHHPAQPFMRPAWQALRFQVLNDLRTTLTIEVDKAAQRARRKAARNGKL